MNTNFVQRKCQTWHDQTGAWNFFRAPGLNNFESLPISDLSSSGLFELRSLPPVAVDEIPRRFSSSSLPPSFASGRFAVFCFPLPRGSSCATPLAG